MLGNQQVQLLEQEYSHLETRQPHQGSPASLLYSAISDVTLHCLLFPYSKFLFLLSDAVIRQFPLSDAASHPEHTHVNNEFLQPALKMTS
jgi:hypothetical protein